MAYGTPGNAHWRCGNHCPSRSPVDVTDSDDDRPARTRPARFGRWPSELFQFVPLIVFVNMRRLGFDYEERFLAGAGAALLVVALLIALRVRMNPLLVGAQVMSTDDTPGVTLSKSNIDQNSDTEPLSGDRQAKLGSRRKDPAARPRSRIINQPRALRAGPRTGPRACRGRGGCPDGSAWGS